MSGDNGFRFAGYHPIISCEGTAEQVAVDILLEADALVFSESDVVTSPACAKPPISKITTST